MTTATHARFADYGRGYPDPTTAACTRHAVGAPSNEATRATNKAQPLPADHEPLECTVCGTENADLIGLIVLDWQGGNDNLYAGPHPRGGGGFQLEFGIGSGGPSLLRCLPEHVAPADTPVPVKDPRCVVVKRPKDQVPAWYRATKAGMYELSLPGQTPDYFTKKGDAVREGHIRLAIIDWHAQRAAKIGAA